MAVVAGAVVAVVLGGDVVVVGAVDDDAVVVVVVVVVVAVVGGWVVDDGLVVVDPAARVVVGPDELAVAVTGLDVPDATGVGPELDARAAVPATPELAGPTAMGTVASEPSPARCW